MNLLVSNDCKLCNLGVGYGDGSQREVAKQYGIGKSSVGRHRRHLGAGSVPPPGPSWEGYDLKQASVRGEDGSWYRYVKSSDVDLLTYDDIEEIFTRPVVLPPKVASGHTQVLNAADLQIGKAKQIGGGTPETLARVRQSIEVFARKCEETRPEAIIVADVGDLIENMFNVPEQMATNDLGLTEQIRTARRVLAEALYRVAGLAPRVVMVSVPSNHGRVRTGYKANAGTVDDDYGLEINHALEDIFTGREGYEHIEFARPVSGHTTAVVESSATRLAFNHGYHSKGIHKHGEWWAKMDHGRRTGWDADILVMSHYHTFGLSQSGDGRWIIATTSPDPGSEWFSKMTGKSSKRGLTAFNVRDGQWFDVAIL